MSLLAENTNRWKAHHVKPGKLSAAHGFASRAVAQKAFYLEIEALVRAQGHYIPWWAIAMIHERECSRGTNNHDCNIGQGSPWNVKSRIIPMNGPFTSFQEAALDSLINQAPKAALNTNWSGGGTLTVLEQYNGLGYARKGLPSPYIWAGTDQYEKGKYVADHVYDPEAVDSQLGCAVMLSALMELDTSIKLDGDLPAQADTPRKGEATLVVTATGGIVETLNALNPYFDLNWMDYTMIGVAFIAIVGYAVHRIIKAKKGTV